MSRVIGSFCCKHDWKLFRCLIKNMLFCCHKHDWKPSRCTLKISTGFVENHVSKSSLSLGSRHAASISSTSRHRSWLMYVWCDTHSRHVFYDLNDRYRLLCINDWQNIKCQHFILSWHLLFGLVKIKMSVMKNVHDKGLFFYKANRRVIEKSIKHRL